MANNRKSTRLHLVFLFPLVLVLTSCSTKYGCPVPDGISCRSMTAVYHRGITPGLPIKQRQTPPLAEFVTPAALTGPLPLRRAPRVIRIWFAPWVDEDEDLHQPGYVYAEIAERKWLFGEYAGETLGNSSLAPLPPPVSQQKALDELDKDRESVEKAKLPPGAQEGMPRLLDGLK